MKNNAKDKNMKNQALKDCIRVLEKRFSQPKIKRKYKNITSRYKLPILSNEPQRIRDMKEGIVSIYE